jgi:hypothetical protein
MSYTNKTQPTTISPEKYLKDNFKGKDKVQTEALALIELYTKATGSKCVMWNKIFGFGKYYYLDSKGGEHTSMVTGFAISATGFTLYNLIGWEKCLKDIKNLGKYRISGISCLAIKSIDNLDLRVLKGIIKQSVAEMKKRYKTEK